ncbi:hypothetical protein ABVT39_022205 [Epinephelus coioides]
MPSNSGLSVSEIIASVFHEAVICVLLLQSFGGAVSTPIIEIRSYYNGSVVLQCESAGWHPEPEVLWLDGEGNLLSAGPTETVRGPDDLYTVSSRVTVEKRHSNSFTCRVQQRNINQTTETHIQMITSWICSLLAGFGATHLLLLLSYCQLFSYYYVSGDRTMIR